MNIYLDNAATTPVDPLVTKAMFDLQSSAFGNPSSPHKHGQLSKIKLEEVRDKIAMNLNCLSKEIVFTSGGTEANNLAILGLLAAAEPGHVLVSQLEHESVFGPLPKECFLQQPLFQPLFICRTRPLRMVLGTLHRNIKNAIGKRLGSIGNFL